MFLRSDMEIMQLMSTNNKNLFVNAEEVNKTPGNIIFFFQTNIELVGWECLLFRYIFIIRIFGILINNCVNISIDT